MLLFGTPLPGGIQTYRLHDLLRNFASRLLTAPVEPLNAAELPGLGLTMHAAHTALLCRYRSRTRANLWHTLLDDGYIYYHLPWHMEKAGQITAIHDLLREETPEGRNGWYQVLEQSGLTATYITHISRAWRLSEELINEEALALSIGLQYRYALITTSLNSIA